MKHHAGAIRLEMPASVSLFLARISPAPPTCVDRLIARYGVTRIGDVKCVNRVLDEGPSDMSASEWLCYVPLPVCWQEKNLPDVVMAVLPRRGKQIF